MRPTKEPTAELIEKYYLVLIKLQKELAVNPYIRTSQFARENHIGIVAMSVLTKCGIIKSISNVRRDPNHVWNTIDPTRQMAVKVIKTMNQMLRDDKKRRKTEKEALEASEAAFSDAIEPQKEIVTTVKAIEAEVAVKTVRVPEEVVLGATTVTKVNTEPIVQVQEGQSGQQKGQSGQEVQQVQKILEVIEQPKYLPVIQNNNHDDVHTTETSFAIYIFGIQIFKMKRTR